MGTSLSFAIFHAKFTRNPVHFLISKSIRKSAKVQLKMTNQSDPRYRVGVFVGKFLSSWSGWIVLLGSLSFLLTARILLRLQQHEVQDRLLVDLGTRKTTKMN